MIGQVGHRSLLLMSRFFTIQSPCIARLSTNMDMQDVMDTIFNEKSTLLIFKISFKQILVTTYLLKNFCTLVLIAKIIKRHVNVPYSYPTFCNKFSERIVSFMIPLFILIIIVTHQVVNFPSITLSNNIWKCLSRIALMRFSRTNHARLTCWCR